MNDNQKALAAIIFFLVCFIVGYGCTLYLTHGYVDAASPISAAAANIERLDKIIELLKEIKYKLL